MNSALRPGLYAAFSKGGVLLLLNMRNAWPVFTTGQKPLISVGILSEEGRRTWYGQYGHGVGFSSLLFCACTNWSGLYPEERGGKGLGEC